MLFIHKLKGITIRDKGIITSPITGRAWLYPRAGTCIHSIPTPRDSNGMATGSCPLDLRTDGVSGAMRAGTARR